MEPLVGPGELMDWLWPMFATALSVVVLVAIVRVFMGGY